MGTHCGVCRALWRGLAVLSYLEGGWSCSPGAAQSNNKKPRGMIPQLILHSPSADQWGTGRNLIKDGLKRGSGKLLWLLHEGLFLHRPDNI